MTAFLPEWEQIPLPIVGMLHAPALPGAPRYAGKLSAVRDAVLRDAEALMAGGVHALMLENFGDVPFFPGRVPAETVAALTMLAAEVRRSFPLPLGMNVLRNDGCSALAIAAAVEARFIRVNVLGGARVTDQGLVTGIAHELLRERERLRVPEVRVLADVDVKHSAPLAGVPVDDEARDLVLRGGADALVVSGRATGQSISLETLRTVKQAVPATPVFLGSGVSADCLARYSPWADGLIVGTSLKFDGVTTHRVDPERVKRFVDAVRHVAAPRST